MQAASDTEVTTRARLGVKFHASWEVIGDTREFFIQALAHEIPDAVRLEQIGIAAHELMENAFRYSPVAEVTISVEVDRGEVRITAENETTPERIADLVQQVAELSAALDPLAHYQQKMLEVVDREEGSGLGLARIRWEAGMRVELEVAGARVRVRAVGVVDE
jgi:anti-sigma regulatory factor (Ser/Thr protein kinase)